MSNNSDNSNLNTEVEINDDDLERATGGVSTTPTTGHKGTGDGPAPEVFKPFTPSY
ncbi:MAG: hypothetical protein RL720_530 [Actinomycetota bacterium]|jgi:hypothetical protein